VKNFWRRNSFDLERELRSQRPQPDSRFVRMLSARVRPERQPGTSRVRLAVAGVLTAVMLVSLASIGGMGYAASGVRDVVDGVHHIGKPVRHHKAAPSWRLKKSSAADQYTPKKKKKKVKGVVSHRKPKATG
jgi:hypothetical protein